MLKDVWHLKRERLRYRVREDEGRATQVIQVGEELRVASHQGLANLELRELLERESNKEIISDFFDFWWEISFKLIFKLIIVIAFFKGVQVGCHGADLAELALFLR